MSNIMTIKFVGDKKIITHPSGVISEYSREHIENFRLNLIKERDRIDRMLVDTGKDIQDCVASKVI